MKECLQCGKRFEAKRKTKKYCSDGCRVTACQERKGISKPDFVSQFTNYVRKTKPNPKVEAIGNIIDVQELKLQELKAKRNNLLNQYQRIINNAPEYKGKLIGLGVGVVLTRNKPILEQLAFTGTLTMFGHLYDQQTAKQNELSKEKNRLFVQHKIREMDEQITQVELSKKHNSAVMHEERKTIKVEIADEADKIEQIKLELPQLVFAEAKKTNKPTSINLSELQNMKFDTLAFSQNYFDLIGLPESNFYAVIYGDAGQGKSTWTIKFAEYLANNFGKVLYNSSEEGLSKSLQNKAKEINSEYLHFSNCKDYNSLSSQIKKQHYRFIIIDSINDMKLSPENLQGLRKEFFKCGFVGILQSTKDGKFKGSNEFAHDADIKIRLTNFIPMVEKTRFK